MAGSGKILDINTEDVQAAAPVFAAQSRELDEALRKLKSSLDSLGSPWGNDDSGKEFHAAYAPKRADIEKAVGVLVRGLSSIHAGLKDMADGHIDNEDLTKGMFTNPGGGA
ncbi:WXG100 family type VII secretion target [Streptomyces sp. NPDC050161]|uniref:WXG100 family type VII secretion target n=1 Tax=Streptomyces sp. NPDC050161 TaxID=3365604 RepID=UPI00379491FA